MQAPIAPPLATSLSVVTEDDDEAGVGAPAAAEKEGGGDEEEVADNDEADAVAAVALALGKEWESWSRSCRPGTENWTRLKTVAEAVEASNRQESKLVTIVDATANDDDHDGEMRGARRIKEQVANSMSSCFTRCYKGLRLQGEEVIPRGIWSNPRVVEHLLHERQKPVAVVERYKHLAQLSDIRRRAIPALWRLLLPPEMK